MPGKNGTGPTGLAGSGGWGTPVCFSDNFDLRLGLVQLKLLTVTNDVNDRALTQPYETHETYMVPSG